MMTDTIDDPTTDAATGGAVNAATDAAMNAVVPAGPSWSDNLAVGPPAIDREHRELLELFRRLGDASHPDSACPGDRRAIVDELARLVALHWDHEEEIMRRGHYPDLAAHRKAHDDLLDQVNHFVTLMDETALSPASLSDFIGGWLVSHILHDDKALGAWLAENPGVATA